MSIFVRLYFPGWIVANELMCAKPVFNPDLAVLPILLATWESDPLQSTIVYQNSILRSELGSWSGRPLQEFINVISSGEGSSKLKMLINNGSLVFSGTINGLEIKFHSRKSENHFQMAISDNTEINRVRDREQRTSLVNSFLNIGSHELKTPLNGILGLTDLLLLNETDAEKQEFLVMIKESAKILNETVSKMLGMIYSEDSINPTMEKNENINISKFLRGMIPTFEKHLTGCIFTETSVDLQAESGVNIPEQHLQAIFTEVAINLRRNTPPGKNVGITTMDDHKSVHVIITNECFGIPTKSLDKIFEPFHRHQDHMKHSSGYNYGQGGIGMGLAIIKKYVEQAGGKVWFENSDNYAPLKENTVSMHMVFPSTQS